MAKSKYCPVCGNPFKPSGPNKLMLVAGRGGGHKPIGPNKLQFTVEVRPVPKVPRRK